MYYMKMYITFFQYGKLPVFKKIFLNVYIKTNVMLLNQAFQFHFISMCIVTCTLNILFSMSDSVNQ